MELIRIAKLARPGVLAGAKDGARLYAALTRAVPASGGGALFLDFSEVTLASASFVREAILPFKSFVRALRSPWYPVIANASDATLEELEIVCLSRSETILTCNVSSSGLPSGVCLTGSLDPKQREAYDFVVENGGATARSLMEGTAAKSERSLSPTAWNNRLNALVDKGIVAETSDGRQKLYTPILR